MVSVFKLMLFILPLLYLSSFQKKDQQQYTINGYAQGTSYSIKYFADKPVVSKDAIDSILVKIDSSMSLYQPHSLINQFNASKEGIVLDDHFTKVIQKSIEIFKDTQGKFRCYGSSIRTSVGLRIQSL